MNEVDQRETGYAGSYCQFRVDLDATTKKRVGESCHEEVTGYFVDFHAGMVRSRAAVSKIQRREV